MNATEIEYAPLAPGVADHLQAAFERALASWDADALESVVAEAIALDVAYRRDGPRRYTVVRSHGYDPRQRLVVVAPESGEPTARLYIQRLALPRGPEYLIMDGEVAFGHLLENAMRAIRVLEFVAGTRWVAP